MALIADGGGRGRTTPWPPTPGKPAGLTPQQVYPYASPWSPYSWNPSMPPTGGAAKQSQYWPSMDAELANQVDQQMGKNVTINVGQQQPAWGGGGGGAPAPPAAPQATPTAWWDIFKPFFEGAGAPSDLLKMRPQDWAAIPQEVRGELERWLRQLGWRPGGTWGRYGATEWGRAEGAQPWAQQGGYLGENVFAGISETLKPWVWWLASQKGWAQPGREKPATQGWGW